MACARVENELCAEVHFAQSIKASSRQAFPTKSINQDLAKMLMESADKKARLYARALLPWLTDNDLSSEEERKAELLGEASILAEQWIAHFEPHKLEAYREQQRQAMAAAAGNT